MAVDLSAGLTQSPIDLSAGLSTTGIDLSAGLSTAHDPNTRFFSGTGQAELRAYQPTVWDRVRNMFTYANPNSRPRIQPEDRADNSMQLIRPEEFMSQTEQRAHPIATGLGQVAGSLTSPGSIALIAGTAGLGEIPGAAAMLPRLISAGFGAQSIYSAYQNVPAIRAAWNRGDASEVERLLTHAVANLAMGALATQHAATGEGGISGRKTATPERVTDSSTAEGVRSHNEAFARAKQELPSAGVREQLARAQEILTSPASPISELLHELAPEVRMADSAAAARDLEEQDTIHPKSDVRVAAPSDIAALRKPIARIVRDDHIPIVTQNEVLAAAVQRMVNNSDALLKAGIDPSQIKSPADAAALLAKASDHIAANLDPRASATLTFDMQRQLASELGMTLEDLLSRKSGESFNAEQAIAARALLNDSGLSVVKSAQRATTDPAALPDMTRALAQHQAILDAVKGMTAEAGRSLGSFRVSDLPASRIADAMSKLPEDAQAEAAKLLSKIDVENPRHVNEFVEQITPSSTADKVWEIFRNSLLSGTATVVKKGVSESTMLALEATKKLVAAGLNKIKGGEEQRYAAESWWFAKGAIDGLQHVGPVLRGEFDLTDMPGLKLPDFERTGQQAIKGKVGDVVRIPSTALTRQTNLMYVLNYVGELNAQAARIAIGEGLEGTELAARHEYLVQHPTEAMTEAANDTALHNTFQKELGKFGKSVQKTIQADPTGVLRYEIPFLRTPINIAKETAYYSPYGFFKGTLNGDVDMQARGLVGSALAAGIAYLALNGHVTGGGSVDPKKRATLEATGWQPYSVKIGNRYIQYRRLEPVGLSMALVADAVHSMASGDPEVVAQSKADNAVAHIARSLQDVAFLPTLANLSEAIANPGARAKNFVARQVASFVPALVKDVAQTADRTVRRPTGIAQNVEARIPGLTQNVPAVIDVTGKPVQRPISALGGANPFPFTTATNDPVVAELARLGISTPQAPTQIKYRGKPTPLTEAERQQFAEAEGAEIYKRVAKLMQSGAWQRRTDDQRRKALVELHRIMSEARPARLTKMRKQTQTELARSTD